MKRCQAYQKCRKDCWQTPCFPVKFSANACMKAWTRHKKHEKNASQDPCPRLTPSDRALAAAGAATPSSWRTRASNITSGAPFFSGTRLFRAGLKENQRETITLGLPPISKCTGFFGSFHGELRCLFPALKGTKRKATICWRP